VVNLSYLCTTVAGISVALPDVRPCVNNTRANCKRLRVWNAAMFGVPTSGGFWLREGFDPERIVEITPLQQGADFGAFSYPTYADFRDKNEVLDGLAAYRFIPMSLSQRGNNERLWGYLVTGNYFDLLGVRAIHGRMFTFRWGEIMTAPPRSWCAGAATRSVLSGRFATPCGSSTPTYRFLTRRRCAKICAGSLAIRNDRESARHLRRESLYRNRRR
jgi:hypothetical protein